MPRQKTSSFVVHKNNAYSHVLHGVDSQEYGVGIWDGQIVKFEHFCRSGPLPMFVREIQVDRRQGCEHVWDDQPPVAQLGFLQCCAGKRRLFSEVVPLSGLVGVQYQDMVSCSVILVT